MSFPIKNKVPQFMIEIPSTKKKIAFRPFLVGEQKGMMIALATEDTDNIVNAIKSIIYSCSYEKVDPDKIEPFDIEYLFLQLRSKSIGESVVLSIECGGCKEDIPFKINIAEAEVDFSTELDKKIKLSESIGVVMRYPTIEESIKLYSTDKIDEVILSEIAGNCISEVWDENDLVSTKDYPKETVDEFINTLTVEQIKKITQFVLLTPSVRMVKSVPCPHCNKNNSVLIEGIENFFG